MSLTQKLLITLVLAFHLGILSWGAYKHSPTIDEKAYLTAGLSIFTFGRYDVAAVSPPLVRLISALPLQFVFYKTDWHRLKDAKNQRIEHSLGKDFVKVNGANVFWLFTLARWACLPFSLIGALVCFFWAKQLYGIKSGFLALCLWCFSPNILAHSQMITADAAAAAFGLLASFTFWRWQIYRTRKSLILCGLSLGLGELTKFTLLVLYPTFLLLCLFFVQCDSKIKNLKVEISRLIELVAIFLISVFIINAGYSFSHSFVRLKDHSFKSEIFVGDSGSAQNRFADTIFGSIPVPLPKDYLLGIDSQKQDFEPQSSKYYRSYLAGKVKDSGWWYYYLYGAAVKIPLGTWVLFLFSIFCGIKNSARFSYSDSAHLLLPAITIFVLVSSQYSFNEHFRYVLPSLGFFFIWISRVAVFISPSRIKSSALIVTSFFWLIATSLSNLPNSLSYFNELARGSENGHFHLIDSNIDWGQDLIYLKDWLSRNSSIPHLNYSYFGDISPNLTGIVIDPAEYFIGGHFIYSNISLNLADLTKGWYALSITTLRIALYFYENPTTEHPYFKKQSIRASRHLKILGYIFKNFKPVDRVGYSIYIYDISEEEMQKLKTLLARDPYFN
jgi:hypothetical protein